MAAKWRKRQCLNKLSGCGTYGIRMVEARICELVKLKSKGETDWRGLRDWGSETSVTL